MVPDGVMAVTTLTRYDNVCGVTSNAHVDSAPSIINVGNDTSTSPLPASGPALFASPPPAAGLTSPRSGIKGGTSVMWLALLDSLRLPPPPAALATSSSSLSSSKMELNRSSAERDSIICGLSNTVPSSSFGPSPLPPAACGDSSCRWNWPTCSKSLTEK